RASETAAPSIPIEGDTLKPSASAAPDAVPPIIAASADLSWTPVADAIQRASETAAPADVPPTPSADAIQRASETAAPPIIAAPADVPPTPVADAIQRASETVPPSISTRSEPVTLSASAAPDAVLPIPVVDAIQRATESDQVSSIDPLPDSRAADQPIDVFQALATSGMVARSTDAAQFQPDSDDIPQRATSNGMTRHDTPSESVDVYTALRVMGLLPAKPSDAAKQSVGASASAPPNANVVQRVTSTPIQRVDSDDAVVDAAQQFVENDDSQELDIEQLARDVFRRLKERLRVESERGRHK
ncbi:MAG: hypothetical protein SGI73_03075, partial [Chloroflexota bacterium]|nr:hypothetical protein [Chloroflexota bacterium]